VQCGASFLAVRRKEQAAASGNGGKSCWLEKKRASTLNDAGNGRRRLEKQAFFQAETSQKPQRGQKHPILRAF